MEKELLCEQSDRTGFLPEFIAKSLPQGAVLDCEKTVRRLVRGQVEEIRLRVGRPTETVALGTGYVGEFVPDASVMEETVYKLCGGSVYAHADTICSGYIRAPDGCRVGICGRAVTVGGRITAVRDVTSVVVRLPSTHYPSFSGIADIVCKGGGMLIISPPGVGKTTVLKSLARELSGKRKKRTAVIDSRGELTPNKPDKFLCADFLDSYPRAEGIEIAVRTLCPELIICDEIGSERDAAAILAAQNCGVPVLATAHGDSIEKTVMRPGIAELHKACVFENYVLLLREKGSAVCRFKAVNINEVNGKI